MYLCCEFEVIAWPCVLIFNLSLLLTFIGSWSFSHTKNIL